MHAAACMPGPAELMGQGVLVAYVPLFWQIGQKEIGNKNGHLITNFIPNKFIDLPPFLQSYHTYFHELYEKARRRHRRRSSYAFAPFG